MCLHTIHNTNVPLWTLFWSGLNSYLVLLLTLDAASATQLPALQTLFFVYIVSDTILVFQLVFFCSNIVFFVELILSMQKESLNNLLKLNSLQQCVIALKLNLTYHKWFYLLIHFRCASQAFKNRTNYLARIA